MSSGYIIKNPLVVLEDKVIKSDIKISTETGKIESIESSITDNDYKQIDAENCVVFPGIIDPHVHFELSAYNSYSSDDFFTGSCAAAAGGITTYLDFAIPVKGQEMQDRINEKNKEASQKSIIDYSFHAQIIEWNEKTPDQIKSCVENGITSFKIFMPQTEGWGINDSELFEALKSTRIHGGLVLVHAEIGELADHFLDIAVKNKKTSIIDYPESRPDFVESLAVVKAVMLAEEADSSIYICHVSSGKSIRELKRFRNNGNTRLFVETCPQYLMLNSEVFNKEDGCLYACCPPIRKKEDNYELWRGIIEGAVDTIGTDHCPFTEEQKKSGDNDFRKTPFGLPGIETSFPLLLFESYKKREIPLNEIAALMSTNPARIFGMYPDKGVILEGSDADLVLIDLEKVSTVDKKNQCMNCDWNPYNGYEVFSVKTTFSRGEIIYNDGEIIAERGRGKLLKRQKPFFCNS